MRPVVPSREPDPRGRRAARRRSEGGTAMAALPARKCVSGPSVGTRSEERALRTAEERMAVRHRLIRKSPEDVWNVLCDVERYGDWVVGTSRAELDEGHWPELGALTV